MEGFFVSNLTGSGIRLQSLILLFVIYGLQQGLCTSWLIIGRHYYFKDILQLTPSYAQVFVAITWVPLNIKPLYGIISDTVRICGYCRTPYILVGTACGAICQTLLSMAVFHSPTSICLLMMGINFSIAMPDVVIDASISRMAQNNEQWISKIHTFCSASFSLCSIIGYLSSGFVIQLVGVENLFLLSSMVSCIVFIFTSLGFLNEDCHPHSSMISIKRELYERNPSLFLNAIFVCLVAIALTSLMIIFHDNIQNQFFVLLISSLLLTTIPYLTLKSTSLTVAKMSIVLFSSDALTPNLETTMFYWYTNATHGPQFSSSYIGTMNMLGYCGMFLGVMLFYKFFRHCSYRTLYLTSQLLLCCGGLLDLLIVFKYHSSPLNMFPSLLSLPDPLLALFGDVIFFPFFRRFKVLPSLILSSKLCPDGLEATLYAMFMSLINLGETIALYSGSLLMVSLGVTEGNYSNLYIGIILKSFLRLLLLPVLIYFTPTGSPQITSSGGADVDEKKKAE